MNSTNVSGYMYATHSVLNRGMKPASAHGTILNITSTTALEAPPFPGEAVYHANKACQEGFTNSLRNELGGTDIRVLALRPGVVAGHFHQLRVGGDDAAYEEFMEGYEYVFNRMVFSSLDRRADVILDLCLRKKWPNRLCGCCNSQRRYQSRLWM
jgi:NADP-dependent 3-hydroxy acid dehydrogenase YdfG